LDQAWPSLGLRISHPTPLTADGELKFVQEWPFESRSSSLGFSSRLRKEYVLPAWAGSSSARDPEVGMSG
jgi:hypothetical protein